MHIPSFYKLTVTQNDNEQRRRHSYSDRESQSTIFNRARKVEPGLGVTGEHSIAVQWNARIKRILWHDRKGIRKQTICFCQTCARRSCFVLPTVLRHVSHLILIKSSHAKRREDWIDGHRFETDKLTSCETRGKNTKRHFFFHIPSHVVLFYSVASL